MYRPAHYLFIFTAASPAVALRYFFKPVLRNFNPMSRHVVIAIRRHAVCQHVQVISACCCLLEVLFRPGYLKAAFFDYRFTSVLSCRCGLFRTFDPTSRPIALAPKAVYHLIQRTTSPCYLQSTLHSGGSLLPSLLRCYLISTFASHSNILSSSLLR